MSNPFYEAVPEPDSLEPIGVTVNQPTFLINSLEVADNRVDLHELVDQPVFFLPFITEITQVETNGTGTVSGITKVAHVPTSRTVEVYDSETMQLINTLQSGNDGTWTLSGLTKIRPFRIIVRGEAGERDVTIDNIYAE